MISVTGIGTREALPDPVPTMMVVVLSQGVDGALVPPRSTGASWPSILLFLRSPQEFWKLEL